MRKIIVLGNCVAERLSLILASIFKYVNKDQPANQWEIIPVRPIFNVVGPEGWQQQAKLASVADLVFTQPLFNFGPCNTAELLATHGAKTHVFSSPDFEAYFPDCIDVGSLPGPEKFAPPLQWHSKILLQCREAGIPVQDVPKVWKNHPLFEKKAVKRAIEASFAKYEKREQNVEIGTLPLIKKFFDKEALFFFFFYPGDRIFKSLLAAMLSYLDYPQNLVESIIKRIPFRDSSANGPGWSEWGFGFNAWPIMTERGGFFNFPERNWFRIGAQRMDLASAAEAWNIWYEAHPQKYDRILKASLGANT